MKSRRFMGVVVLVLCAVLAFGGQSFAEEFGWPVPGHTYITATYTYPSSGNRHSSRYSTPDGRAAGIDIGINVGTEIYAPAAGTVQRKSYSSSGFGYHFEIKHDDGTITLYAHLSDYSRVQNGQRVNRGDLIALSGRSGNVTGPHLHYEMYNPTIGLDTYQYYKTNGYRDPRNMIRPPVITDVPNIALIAGVPAYYQCKADGDVTTWSTEGDLPPGLEINPSTGEISGTPLNTDRGKSSYWSVRYSFSVTASNSGVSGTPKTANIYIYEPPVITTNSTLPNGTKGQLYSKEFYAEGTEVGMRWKIKGSLPRGLTFKHAKDSRVPKIEGTPTTSGTYQFTLELSNSSSVTTSKTFSLQIPGAAPEPNMWIDGKFKTPGQIGKWYSSSVKLYFRSVLYLSRWSAGSNVSVIDGSRPDGLSLSWATSSSGIDSYPYVLIYLRGFPTKPGSYTFTIRASNSTEGYTDSTQTINILDRNGEFPDPSMYTVFTFRKGKVGVYYDDYIAVYGGSAPYTVEVRSNFPTTTGMVPGLSPYIRGRYIHLEGTPTRTGTFTFTLRIKGAHGGYIDQDFKIIIADNNSYGAAPGTDDGNPSKPTILTESLPSAISYTHYTATLEAYGTTPITWSCDNLPEGFILTEDGVLSGIPSEEGSYSLNITATNSEGSTTQKLTLTVKPEKPTITTLILPYGTVNEPYSFVLESEGDSITWSKTGSLPDGLTLDKNTGEISGTPKADGKYTFTAKAKNITGTSTAQLQIIVLSGDTAYDDTDEDIELPEVSATNNMELSSLSGNKATDGTIRVTAGTPLTFRLGGEEDTEISGAKVFVNDSVVTGVSVASNGTFTIPGGLVQGSFTVYASAVADGLTVETNDINVVASAANNDTPSDTPSGEEPGTSHEDPSGSGGSENPTEGNKPDSSSGNHGQETQSGGTSQDGGSSGGCSVNLAGIFLLLMSSTILLKKK